MEEQNVNETLQSEKQDGKLSGATMKSPFLTKLENFWYHYKWPFLIGLFTLVVLIVCLVQCSSKSDYDIYVMYAGPVTLTQEDIEDIKTSLEPYVTDLNEDGEITIAVRNLVIYSLAELEKKKKEGVDVSFLANTSQMNTEVFDNEIQAGEAVICLLDPALFESVCLQGGFMEQSFSEKVPDYARLGKIKVKNQAGTETVREGYFGYRLGGMDLHKLPGLSRLRGDTVLCVRKISTMQSLFGKKKAERHHANNVAIFNRIIAGEEE
ncbi:MAG: hypothetical protein IJW71_05390 [Clostridia bacterium]|nr:hypothetical protein [Clostridia bacterium]